MPGTTGTTGTPSPSLIETLRVTLTVIWDCKSALAVICPLQIHIAKDCLQRSQRKLRGIPHLRHLMEAFYFRLPFFFVLLLEMSYFRSISAFSFQRYNGAGISRSSRNSGAWPYTTMNLVRGTAANSKFEAWYQKTIESLSLCEPLISIPLDEEFSSSLGLIGKSNVTFKSKAWQSKSLRYIRLISFVGEGYDVFNFLAIPRSTISLPILGIDVVSLPSKCRTRFHPPLHE